MKQWFLIFSAVLAAGVLVIGILWFDRNQTQAAEAWDHEAIQMLDHLKAARLAFSVEDPPDLYKEGEVLNLQSQISRFDRFLEIAPGRAKKLSEYSWELKRAHQDVSDAVLRKNGIQPAKPKP